MMKSFRFVLSVLILITIFTSFVFAQEIYDGYIVKLNDRAINVMTGVSLFDDRAPTIDDAVKNIVSCVDYVSELYAPQGLLKVDNIDTLQYLESLGIIQNYEKDVYCELYGYTPSLNPYYAQQWAFAATNAQYAWDSGLFGNNIRVAVIDSGVYPHNELLHCLEKGYNYVDNNTDTTDTYGHGTFVAGVIAGQCNNTGIVGLAHRASIVPFKVTDGSTLPISRVINSIYAAVDNYDCDVINLSLGTQTPVDELYSAVNHAITNGVIVVAAAGNITTNTPLGPCYPAAYDEVISVANARQVQIGENVTYEISSSSQYQSLVDIAAPGSNLISLMPSLSGLASGSGTSYAAPYVSAAAAIAKSIEPAIENTTFSYLLAKSANSSYKAQSGQSDGHWGSGLIDIQSLIKYIYMRFPKAYFLSDIDIQPYGNNTSVYLHNPNSVEKTFTLILTSYSYENNIKTLSGVKLVPVTLQAYQTRELSFTQLGLSGDVSAMIFGNLTTLSPLGQAKKL